MPSAGVGSLCFTMLVQQSERWKADRLVRRRMVKRSMEVVRDKGDPECLLLEQMWTKEIIGELRGYCQRRY